MLWKPEISTSPGGGGESHIKRSGMLATKFELTPKRRPIWVWLKLYSPPKRYHLKRNRLEVYQPLFRKGDSANRPTHDAARGNRA